MTAAASSDVQRVLFLAQMPPPVHGVTTMSRRVRQMMEAMAGFEVEHMWLGGARTLHDVGRKDLSKITGFAWLLARLAGRWIAGKRYAFTYQTLAPHGEAALRDALIIWFAKRIAPRALVHLHTQGIEEILSGETWKARVLRSMISGSELIAITGHVGDVARRSGCFKAVHNLPNLVIDPGKPGYATGQRLRCGYLGNFDARKGVLRFIDCIAAMKAAGIDVSASIAGGPTKHLSREDIVAYCERVGVGGETRVLGFISEAEKHDLFRQIDLFVYPTDHDLAPLVVLEAMACGTVPIVFDTGGLREMVGAEFAGNVIAEKRDPSVYQRQIVEIAQGYVSDPNTLEAAKRAARATYEARYTPATYVKTLATILTGRPVPPVM